VVAGLLFVVSSISAHHGTSGYDMEKVITLSGTVTSFNWSNPHCLVHIDVKDSKGDVKDWIVELAAPTLMTRNGWTKDSLKPGDEVVASATYLLDSESNLAAAIQGLMLQMGMGLNMGGMKTGTPDSGNRTRGMPGMDTSRRRP